MALRLRGADVPWIERTLSRRKRGMDEIDLKKLFKALYHAPSDRFELVDVPAMTFVK